MAFKATPGVSEKANHSSLQFYFWSLFSAQKLQNHLAMFHTKRENNFCFCKMENITIDGKMIGTFELWSLKFQSWPHSNLLNGVNFTFWCELHHHHHTPTSSVWSFATGYYAKNGRMDPILVSGGDTRAKVNTGCILSDQSGQSVPLINLNNSIWKDCINLEENINKTK